MAETDTDILQIDISDPLNAFLQIDKQIRPDIKSIDTPTELDIANRYVKVILHAAKKFGIDINVREPTNENSVVEARVSMNALRAEIEKKKIDLLFEKGQRDKSLNLDATWRDKIHSYLAIIRQIVDRSDAPQPIKESILTKLHALDAEVDRGRTRIEIFTEVLVGLCEGISAGATALTPAVRLVERVIGALARLHPIPTVPALPPPEDYGLKLPPEMLEPPRDDVIQT